MKKIFLLLSLFCLLFSSCEKDLEEDEPLLIDEKDPTPTPYELELPRHFSWIIPTAIPQDNPMTVEGVKLGRKLFFEKLLSGNNSISCASCHQPQFAFNDKGNALSEGIHGQQGERNAMPLFNLLYAQKFNWHGSANSIEEQAFGPVRHPLEMVEDWKNAARELQAHPEYPPLFKAAFGTFVIDSVLVVKALAQFERTLISADSKADNYIKERLGIPTDGPGLNAQEKRGLDLYMSESKGDCFHCHGGANLEYNPLMTDNIFRNNGLDANPDQGLAEVTGKPSDIGKFKTPSLRNLVFTSPYMHDGRFETLEEVIDFYTSGVQASPTTDPKALKSRSLTAQEKEDLIAFLLAFTDSSFVQNPAFQDPDK